MHALLLPQNDESHLRLRRLRDMLAASGTGVVMFSIWNAIKAVFFFLVYLPRLSQVNEFFGSELFERVVVVAILIYFVGSVGIRLYVGMSARAESSGMKHGWFYLVLAVLLAGEHITSLIGYFTLVAPFGGEVFESLIPSIVIELTSLLTICIMEYSAISTKRLLKTMHEEV